MTSELVELVAANPDMTGSFAFHGEWFGRPYDNWHHIVEAVDLQSASTRRGVAGWGVWRARQSRSTSCAEPETMKP